MSFESRLRYFHLYKDLILETLGYDKEPTDMSDDLKVRLASAYLNLMADDTQTEYRPHWTASCCVSPR